MNSRYIFLLLIPAFFTVNSCSGTTHDTDGFKALKPLVAKSNGNIFEEPSEPAKIQPKEKATDKNGLAASKKFNMGYLHFDVADFYGEITPLGDTNDGQRYKFRLYAKSTGFIDYLFGWVSHTVSVFRVSDNKVIPESFKTKVVLKKKTREIALDYDGSGKSIVLDKVTPPDNRAKRPAVETALKQGTYDPLSIVVEARKIIMKTVKDNKFNKDSKHVFALPLYDGRRRSDISFKLFKEKVEGNYHLRFLQKPVAGYTNNETKDIKEGDRVFDIYIEPQGFWPTSATGRAPIGNARANFVKDCNGKIEDCVK